MRLGTVGCTFELMASKAVIPSSGSGSGSPRGPLHERWRGPTTPPGTPLLGDEDAIEDERDEFTLAIAALQAVRDLVERLRPQAGGDAWRDEAGTALAELNVKDEWLVRRILGIITEHFEWEDRASKKYPWIDFDEAEDRGLYKSTIQFAFEALEWNPDREPYDHFEARALLKARKVIAAYADGVSQQFEIEYGIPRCQDRRYGPTIHRRLAERLVLGKPWPALTKFASGEPSGPRKQAKSLALFIGLTLPKSKSGRPPGTAKKHRRTSVI